MKKIIYTLKTLIILSLIISCQNDDTIDDVMPEEQKTASETSSRNFNSNNDIVGPDGESATCVVIFTFNSPFLTPFQKTQIRNNYNNNHFTIFGYSTINSSTEEWYVFCQEYEEYLDSIDLDISDTDCSSGNGCVTYDSRCEKASCENGGGSNGGGNDGGGKGDSDPIDPLDSPFD
ncbi:hypothetical protein [Aquimarina sp. 2201CG5-10]|uniref:hypothetical protein n=1 Tax=Aquimarina callyspongiae TaxID=3098150 RepID=UPI002AB35D7D|nr:hypothetical protein [Aquimarina sp. 2201CG5-10]MDY8138621.1 hypothetical protein [Aquimarina sp. 2201CG5-10]